MKSIAFWDMINDNLINEVRCSDVSYHQDFFLDLMHEEHKNNFIILLKPELFVENVSHRAILDFLFTKISMFGVDVNAVKIFNARYAQKERLLERQYHILNNVSRNGLAALPASILDKINKTEQHFYVGSYEFLSCHADITAKQLEVIAHKQGTKKLSNGIYLSDIPYYNNVYHIFNAFHPFQIEHFYQLSNVMSVLWCSSDMPYEKIANELIGFFDPSLALSGSLRNEFFSNSQTFGLKDIGVLRNCVHISPSPLEGIKSLSLYFDLHEKVNLLYLVRKINALGLSQAVLNAIYNNEDVLVNGSVKPAYEHFEGLDADDIIDKLTEVSDCFLIPPFYKNRDVKG